MTRYEELLNYIVNTNKSGAVSSDVAKQVTSKRDMLLATLSVRKRESFVKIEDAQLEILEALGEDPSREGLIGTPFRVAKMLLLETMSGYNADLVGIADSASFTGCKKGNIVLVKDITFYSTCEHHVMPFFGKAHVAYLPNERVLGLSKIPRVVKTAAKKLQLQENLGQEIADAIQEASQSRAVCVILESEKHLCVAMRGVEDTTSETITIATATSRDGWEVDKNDFVDVVLKMLKK